MKLYRRRYNRSGMTLLEMVTVVAVISLLGTVTVRLLHAMLRQQTATTTQLALASSMSRLGEQLRKDVHNASEVDIYLSGTLVLETSKEEKVECYEIIKLRIFVPDDFEIVNETQLARTLPTEEEVSNQ